MCFGLDKRRSFIFVWLVNNLKQYRLVKQFIIRSFYSPIKLFVFSFNLPTLALPNSYHNTFSILKTIIINDPQEKYSVCSSGLSLQLLHVISVMISSALSSSTWLWLFSIWPLCSSARCQGQCALWSAWVLIWNSLPLISLRPLPSPWAPHSLNCRMRTQIKVWPCFSLHFISSLMSLSVICYWNINKGILSWNTVIVLYIL